MRNPYEYLKTPYLGDYEPTEAQEVVTVTDDPTESVTVYLTELIAGVWTYGYEVKWANGRDSHLRLSPTNGMFHTKREALLYAIGFMLIYAEWFTPATCAALRRAEAEYSQATLF